MNKEQDTKVQTAIDQFVNSSAPIQFTGNFSLKSQREYAIQLKIAIVKTMMNLATGRDNYIIKRIHVADHIAFSIKDNNQKAKPCDTRDSEMLKAIMLDVYFTGMRDQINPRDLKIFKNAIDNETIIVTKFESQKGLNKNAFIY